MRIARIGAGLVLTGALALTGCSGGAGEPDAPAGGGTTASPAAEETSEPAESASPAPVRLGADCPVLAQGVSLDSDVLSSCSEQGLQGIAGYAATMSMMGVEFTVKANPGAHEFQLESAVGSFVALGERTWVRPPGAAWSVGDPNSTDSAIASLSTSAVTAATSGNALESATGGAQDMPLTVTGRERRAGQDVWVLTGSQGQEASLDVAYYVTDSYVPVAVELTASTSGMDIATNYEITEFDKNQVITPPM